MSTTSLLSLTALALILSACGGPGVSTAMAPTPTLAGGTVTVSEIDNIVEARQSAVEAFAPAQNGYALGEGGQVRTGEDSRARLDFVGGTIVRLSQNSSLTIQARDLSSGGPLSRIALDAGKVWVSLLGGGALEAVTPVGVASVRGSFAMIQFDPGDPGDPNDDVLIVDCVEGTCGAADEALGALERGSSSRGGRTVRTALGGAAVQDFLQNNPDVAEAVSATLTALPPRVTDTPTSTATATGTATATATDTATATATRRPTRRPTATPSNTPVPECKPPEFFDPFLNRCRLPDPTPYRSLMLTSSPLYRELAHARPSPPVGAVSTILTLLGVATVAWMFQRRRLP